MRLKQHSRTCCPELCTNSCKRTGPQNFLPLPFWCGFLKYQRLPGPKMQRHNHFCKAKREVLVLVSLLWWRSCQCAGGLPACSVACQTSPSQPSIYCCLSGCSAIKEPQSPQQAGALQGPCRGRASDVCHKGKFLSSNLRRGPQNTCQMSSCRKA